MTVLAEILRHPANRGTRVRTIARWALHNLRRRTHPDRVVTVPFGHQVLTGPLDHPSINYAVYVPSGLPEPDLSWAMKSLLGVGGVFIDVGANIGLFSLAAADHIGRSGHIVAIEPAESQLPFLELNLARLSCSTDVVGSAVADARRSVELSPGGPTTRFLRSDPEPDHRIETEPLDEILDRLHVQLPVDQTLLKVDVEGWEPAVIEGAHRTIESVRGIVLEARGHDTGCPVTWARCVEILSSAGFIFTWPDTRHGKLHVFEDPPRSSPFNDYVLIKAPDVVGLRHLIAQVPDKG